jgi:NADP-dependent 3-hydroxy acid dehydrogenase YdfG
MGGILENRTALVTGGSSGLGQATAKRLTEAGARVVVCGRSDKGLEETVSAIRSAGGTADAVRTDLAKPGAAAEVVRKSIALAGTLDILVNNAGVMHPHLILKGTRAIWEEMFNVNVLALLEATQEAVAHMQKTGRDGHIVNISSLSARMDNGSVYGASKVAVDMISKSLRGELEGCRIRVTNILPGGFTTNLGRDFPPEATAAMLKTMHIDENSTPEQIGAYMRDPDDIARAVLFAVSQPIETNIFEMIVRPACSVNMPSY